jgi:rubrerythrin
MRNGWSYDGQLGKDCAAMNIDFMHLRDGRSRRDFFRLCGLTGAGGSVALLAACGGDGDGKSSKSPSEAVIRERQDIKMLNGALDLENTAIAAYTAGAALLKGDALKIGKTFLAHEKEHARALEQAIREAGGTPGKPKSKAEYEQGFPTLKSQADVLRFAADLENVAIAAYLDAIPRLSRGALRQSAAAIMSNEAEHEAVLQGAISGGDVKRQVPDAFVTGKV